MIPFAVALLPFVVIAWHLRSRWRDNVLASDCGEQHCIYCDPRGIAEAFGPDTAARVVQARARIPARSGPG